MEKTLEFLKQLKNEEYSLSYNDNDLLKILFTSLVSDGYNCSQNNDEIYQIKRSLSSERLKPSDSEFITYIILVMLCILCAAAANGLTQGLLSLDLLEMKIKAKTGTDEEKIQAKRVLPIIERHHLLLVSLMTWNASANEALPIFLDALVPGWLAIVLSVTIVLFVGEIIPAALLTGPNQLKLASFLVPVVYCVIAIFSPISYPVSLLLDYLLGDDHGLTIYNKTELATMVKIQHEEGKHDEFHDVEASKSLSMIHKEEVTIIEGALKFRDMLVREIMTPVKNAFTLQADQTLNFQTMAEIFKAGYSRIPVWDKDPNEIIGLILTKDLIFVDPGDATPVRIFVSLFGRAPIVVWHDQKLGEVLSVFKQSKGHLAIVRDVNNQSEKDPFYEVVGIVTLEDIVEEILGVDIEDEHDVEDLDINHYVTKAQRNRDANFARLKLLHPKLATESLSSEELSAVTSYLITEIKQIKQYYKNDVSKVRDLVSTAKVLTLTRNSLTPLKPEEDDIIYHNGQVTTRFILILNGKVTILVGKDQFRVESGPWSVLGADTLTVAEGEYIPDFTAYISSETVRIIIFYPFISKLNHQHSIKLNSEFISNPEEIPLTYPKPVILPPSSSTSRDRGTELNASPIHDVNRLNLQISSPSSSSFNEVKEE